MPWRSIGVNFKEEEIKQLDKLANRLNVTRTQVMRFFVLYGLGLVSKGKLDLNKFVETERKLKPPK